MYRKKHSILYVEFGLSTASGIHWGSWNASPKAQGALLYTQLQRKEIQLCTLLSRKHKNKFFCVYILFGYRSQLRKPQL